jgi:hypothetical protein
MYVGLTTGPAVPGGLQPAMSAATIIAAIPVFV